MHPWRGALLVSAALLGAGAAVACATAPTDNAGAPGDDAGAPVGDPDGGKPKKDAAPDAPDDDAWVDPGTDAGTCVTTPPTNKCGLAPQCGCTLAETCDLVDDVGNVGCVTAGLAPLGNPCAVTAGCAVGLTCIFGTCHPYCAAPADCATAATNTCLQVTTTDGGAVPNLKVCQINCDLKNPASCGGTTPAGIGACVPDGRGATDCETGGTVAASAHCDSSLHCAPGLVCLSPANLCKAWCRVGTSDCSSGTCGGFAPKELIGGVEWGACP